MRLGVVGHRGYEGLPEVLRTLVKLAPELDMKLFFEQDLHQDAGAGDVLRDPDALEALLTLGGDGTLLRGARLLKGHPTPILGVNLGRLGFLTSCGAKEMEDGLRRLANGDFVAEARMALEARTTENGMLRKWYALNDVVLHKGGFARVMRVSVTADGEQVASYAADGICVSTPTGSTAYNLSAGGPIVVPTLETILLTPISAHTLALRPVVLPGSTEILLRAEDGPEELLVTVDGQSGAKFSAGQTLLIRRAPKPVCIVRFPGMSFFSRLRHKLAWGGLAERDEPNGG